MEAIAGALGHPITLQGRTRHSFPTASEVARAGEQFLRDLGLGFRAKYLSYAAIQVAEGSIDLEELRLMPYSKAKAKLTALPGVGPKIADCVLVFSLDKLEAFPIDRWVGRAMREWYLDGEDMSYEQLVLWAQDYFGPHAGYAQQYLFHGRRLSGNAA